MSGKTIRSFNGKPSEPTPVPSETPFAVQPDPPSTPRTEPEPLTGREAALRELLREAIEIVHQTDSIRSHADPNDKTGWNVHGIETCEDRLCMDALAALAPSDPDWLDPDWLDPDWLFVLKATHPIGGVFTAMPASNVERVCEVARRRLGEGPQSEKERLAQSLRDGDEQTFIAAIRKANRPTLGEVPHG